MKTRHQLFILFSSALVLLLVTAYFLVSTISDKNETLLNEGQKELAKETNKVITLISLSVENWVFDNTYWDDIVTAFKKQDTSWVNDNYSATMGKYGANYLWLLNTNGSFFYNSVPVEQRVNGSFFMEVPTLIDSLKQKPFRHFFTAFHDETLEIFIAPVQPSNDSNRVSTPNGYFIAAQTINERYFEKLTVYTGRNKHELLSGDARVGPVVNADSSIVSSFQPLNGIINQPAAWLKVTKKLNVIDTYKNDLRNYLLIFIGIIILIFVILNFFFSRRIITPIQTLSESLKKKDPSVLSKLRQSKSEFGELATLNCNFFEQNEQLENEIGIRINSEKTLKKTADELHKETLRAEKSLAAKSEFLSTMSHEIRTPLNGVIGISNLLIEEELTAKQKELVKILHFSSGHLLSMLSDILDFSKIESGNMQFDNSSFDLKKTCQNVINLYESKAAEKSIGLNFIAATDINIPLYGDSVRLTQVLTNLLSNAIKFTDKGQVTLEYKKNEETNSRLNVQFSVKDTGIGISAEQHEKIFESFTQADRSISGKYGGTGLGLTISKKIIELQEGTINLKSEPGKGSEFIFSLSFDKQASMDSLPVLNVGVKDIKGLQGMRVLVVEDNLVNAHVLSSFLAKWNVQSDLARNGQEAIDKLRQKTFDVVLMDLHMPVIDGKTATVTIRKDKQASYQEIPIVALTADATSETRRLINDFGFTAYLSKPFNPDTLYNILNTFYENQNGTNGSAKPAAYMSIISSEQ